MTEPVKDQSYYMAGVPRLLDEYTQATASMMRPDLPVAKQKLDEIIANCMQARALIEEQLRTFKPHPTIAEVSKVEVPADIKAMIVELYGPGDETLNVVLDAKQPLHEGASFRYLIASGEVQKVRQQLDSIIGGAYT
jgi:hypothetical protein